MKLARNQFTYAGSGVWSTTTPIGDYGSDVRIELRGDGRQFPVDLFRAAYGMAQDIERIWNEACQYVDDDMWDHYCDELGGGVPYLHAIQLDSTEDFQVVLAFPKIDDVIVITFEDGEPTEMNTVG